MKHLDFRQPLPLPTVIEVGGSEVRSLLIPPQGNVEDPDEQCGIGKRSGIGTHRESETKPFAKKPLSECQLQ